MSTRIVLSAPGRTGTVRKGGMVVVCAWCERVRAGGDLWRAARPGEMEDSRISHGICPECVVGWTSSLKREDLEE